MNVLWTVPAAADLEEIEDFVAQESPKSAYRLISDIIDRTEAVLRANPLAGKAGRVTGTRELVLPHTRYIVVYRARQSVEIVAVMHGARDWPKEFT